MRSAIIIGFENYCVYEDGSVENLSTHKKLKGTIRLHGYLVYRLSKQGKKYQFYAHRLVATAFIPNPNNYTIVNHKDGNKLNNNVDNLEWCTQSYNMEHAHKKKLIKSFSEPLIFTGKISEQEQFKEIDGFSHYLISNYGRVINKDTNRILKASIVCGYYKVKLSEKGKVTDFLVHYLVQKYFNGTLPQKKKECIDHIDGDKLNNMADNLRVVTFQENSNAAFYQQNLTHSIKPIEQYSKSGDFIRSFPSCREAARVLGLDSSSITKVVNGKRKTCGGFIFREKTI